MKYIVHENEMEILKFIFCQFPKRLYLTSFFQTENSIPYKEKKDFQSLINIHTILILPRHKITVSTNVHNVHIHRDTEKNEQNDDSLSV